MTPLTAEEKRQILAFVQKRAKGDSAQLTELMPPPAWWRIRDLETAPPKLAGARLEGPSQGWPA